MYQKINQSAFNVHLNVCLFRNDDLIQNCIKEAEKHAGEIAELENRTALHIEYAQEKQIEIQNLEVIIDTYKNKSKDFITVERDLKSKVTNLEQQIIAKDSLINKLKDDVVKLQSSFSKEENKKHKEIESLEERIENASIELANDKIVINNLKIENENKIGEYEQIIRYKDDEIKESSKRLDKYKHEKLNLLKIVQQLADLSNPSLTFTATIDDLDYYDTIAEEEEQEAAPCCDNTQEFENYDVNVVSSTSEEEESVVYYDEEEGSSPIENFSESFESNEDDEDLL